MGDIELTGGEDSSSLGSPILGEKSKESKSGEMKRILVVDNEYDPVLPYVKYKVSQGCEHHKNFNNLDINSTKSGIDAIKRAHDFDCLIFNLILGSREYYNGKEIDGLGCLRILRQEVQDVPVITTSKASFVLPPPELQCTHIQKKEDLEKRLFQVLSLGAVPSDFYDFYDADGIKEALGCLSKFKDAIANSSAQELQTITGIDNFKERIMHEVHYYNEGSGGRDKGFITDESAIYYLLLRRYICREIGAKGGIDGLENKIWAAYNAAESKGRGISITGAYNQVLIDERKGKQEDPYVIVLVGPTCSGKSTQALALEKKLNELGMPSLYIGNMKTGEERKEEKHAGRDKYISQEKADKFENDPNYSVYHHLDSRRYFSKDKEILDTLRSGQNVIIVRNIEGMKVAGDLIYRHDDLKAKLLSFSLSAGEDELKRRLHQRVEQEKISDEEHQKREDTLRKTLMEYGSQDFSCDFLANTNQPVEKTTEDILAKLKEVRETKPLLHFEFSNYSREVIRKLTGRYDRRKDFEADLLKHPVELSSCVISLPAIDIVRAHGNNGVYAFYLNPFYTQDSFAQGKPNPKELFVKYLESLLGEPADKSNLAYNLNPSSNYAKTFAFYPSNNLKIRLDDIALFTLKKGASYQYAGNEFHSVAFVCLEKKPNSTIDIKENK